VAIGKNGNVSSNHFNTNGGIHEVPLGGTVGKLFLCGKHYIGPDVHAVREEFNIHTVVCLVEHHELENRYDNYLQWHKENAGTGGLWYPMPDLTYPSLDDSIEFVQQVTALVRDHGNVVVHCAAGIGRAGTTATAICMMLGYDMDDALQHVRAHRPMAGPEAGTQIRFIEELAEHLQL
jgi:protein-tyrosine phosphatase